MEFIKIKIKKQLIIRQEFNIIGVKDKAQNLPETFVATPNNATIETNGIKKIVILVITIIWFIMTLLFEKPGAKK